MNKHPTVIEDGASTGSHTVLVAPSTLGKGAKTGAGAVVAKKVVPPGEVWVGVPAKRIPLTPASSKKKLPAPAKKRSGPRA